MIPISPILKKLPPFPPNEVWPPQGPRHFDPRATGRLAVAIAALVALYTLAVCIADWIAPVHTTAELLTFAGVVVIGEFCMLMLFGTLAAFAIDEVWPRS